jgi:hypothetical protein
MNAIRNFMKNTFLLLIIVISVLSLKAQDTVYVLYEPDKELTKCYGPVGKHKDDPDKRTQYPFDGGGRMYVFEKVYKSYSRALTFSYTTYTPEWMDYQFDYKNVDIDSIFRKVNFKDMQWFNDTSYKDILTTFRAQKLLIYLLDERYIENGKGVLVKVHFNFHADE